MLHISGALIYLGLVAVFITDSFANDVEDNWQLVFHAVKGNGKDVRDAWNARSPSVCSPDNGCLSPGFKLDNWRDNMKHLRSPLIDQWESLRIQKIRVVLGRNGKTLAFLEFDGSGSNKLNWFSKSRLLHSSWSDLKTSRTNYFSIKGHDRDGRRPVKRHFFVNKRYGRCPNDVGWFVIIDKTDLCPWARKGRTPLFLYSRGSKAANWNRRPGVADVMNVYIGCKFQEGFPKHPDRFDLCTSSLY
ncbi:uncharacterized protein LOC125677747 [Ostrea edulis]|uniref:uncharacterized protein LOC125677747 n=1 Tax=Ostrea edulis TaxID=37623 RepID=UPI0024AFBCF7|nr:uncharacterized protein LOC125677747 [Ostrea edulis]